jgi:hypothetical protein
VASTLAFRIWRGLFVAQWFVSQEGEPKSNLDRGLRIFGAVLLSAVVVYFVGFGLGLYGSN